MTPGQSHTARNFTDQLYTSLAVLSLLLTLIVGSLWVRSVWWTGDACFLASTDPGVRLLLASRSGCLCLGWEVTPAYGHGKPFTYEYRQDGGPLPMTWLPQTERSSLTQVTLIPDWLILILFYYFPLRWLLQNEWRWRRGAPTKPEKAKG
jgi:hypothetical protein